MSAGVLERVIPGLDDSPPIDMPPLNIVKCQCSESCPFSGPCELEATGDDLLCTPCRKALEAMAAYRAGMFSQSIFQLIRRGPMIHCHRCDPEFDKVGDDDATSSS